MTGEPTGTDTATSDVRLRAAAARAAAGLPVATDDLPPRAVRAVRMADRLGAPRVPALEAAATAARDRDELMRAVDVAAAEGRSVARALVLAPPLVGPLTAALVSDAPFAVWSTSLGRAVLVLAGLLWVAGGLAVRALVRRATSPPAAGGGWRGSAAGPGDELLDLVAVALSAGADLSHALRLAGELGGGRSGCARVALWLELGAQGPPPAGWDEVAGVLAAARRDGVPLAGLVRSLAADARRGAHHEAMQRAARLGARLTLPTTLLLLPAAGLVVVAPLLHGALAALA